MQLVEMIRYDEGEKLAVYQDSLGYWTVGVGHLLTKNPSKQIAIDELDKTIGSKSYGYINRKQSEIILQKDIDRSVFDISRSKLANTYISIDGPRRAALVNMVFQLGLNGVLKFKKMIQHLNARDYDKAADEALDSTWAKQTPNRAKRVTDVIRYGDFRSFN